MTVGESFKRFRKDFGVTQQQVADAIKILKPAYQKYEYDIHVPSATALIKIADAYDVSLDYLVGRTDNPKGGF